MDFRCSGLLHHVLVRVFQRFRGQNSTLKMEVSSSREVLVQIQKKTAVKTSNPTTEVRYKPLLVFVEVKLII